MFLCDIHSHSKISHDSKAELFDTAQAAIDAGLQEFCVTDHCDLLGLEGEPVTGFDWPAARAQFRAVKAELGDRLTLRLGLELGSAVSDPDEARAVLAQGGDELDFVLGSIHNWIGMEGNLDFYFSDFHDNLALARRAVESTLDHTWTLAAKLPDCYDSLAHIIYPLRYIHRDGLDLTLADYAGGRISRPGPLFCAGSGSAAAGWSRWARTPTGPRTWQRASPRRWTWCGRRGLTAWPPSRGASPYFTNFNQGGFTR